MNPAPTTVPLTPEQRAWLRINLVLPVVFLVVLLAVIGALGVCVVGSVATHPVVRVGALVAAGLMMGVIAMAAVHARNHWRDVQPGVAQVQVARLRRKHSTSQSPRTFYADFDEIGSFIVMHDLYETLEEGATYRVTYSPHTRRGWAMEAVPPS